MEPEWSEKKAGKALAWLGTIGPLGAHRFYLGRWVSGALLGGLMAGLLVWSGIGVVGLFQASLAGRDDGPGFLDVLVRLGLTVIWGLWPAVDLWLIAAGRMRDGAGKPVEPRGRRR